MTRLRLLNTDESDISVSIHVSIFFFLDINRKEISVFYKPSFLNIPRNLPPSLLLCLTYCPAVYTYVLVHDAIFLYPCFYLRTTALIASLASALLLLKALAIRHVFQSDGENMSLAVTMKLAKKIFLSQPGELYPVPITGAVSLELVVKWMPGMMREKEWRKTSTSHEIFFIGYFVLMRL